MRITAIAIAIGLAASTARADDDLEGGFQLGFGAAPAVSRGSSLATAEAGDSDPFSTRWGGMIGSHRWKLELSYRGADVQYEGARRHLSFFEPALRYGGSYGPLSAFARGDLLIGGMWSLDETSCSGGGGDEGGRARCTTTVLDPGHAALGIGLGAGISLGTCFDDGTYLGLGATATVEAIAVGDASGVLHTTIYGAWFGGCG